MTHHRQWHGAISAGWALAMIWLDASPFLRAHPSDYHSQLFLSSIRSFAAESMFRPSFPLISNGFTYGASDDFDCRTPCGRVSCPISIKRRWFWNTPPTLWATAIWFGFCSVHVHKKFNNDHNNRFNGFRYGMYNANVEQNRRQILSCTICAPVSECQSITTPYLERNISSQQFPNHYNVVTISMQVIVYSIAIGWRLRLPFCRAAVGHVSGKRWW